MEPRIEELETRVTYQEATIESLTAAQLEQQQTIEQLRAELDYLKSLLKDLNPGITGSAADEPPPPHY